MKPTLSRAVRRTLRRIPSVSLALAAPLAVCTPLALVAPSAGAADWEVKPRLEAGYQWDDNYRLSLPGTEIEVSGAMADAQLEIEARSQTVEFSFTPRVRATYFPNDREENSEDYLGRVELLQRGQTSEATVRLDYAREDVVSSEQPGTEIDTDLGVPTVGEGGLVVVRNRRQLISIQPALSHELAPRHHLRYELGYTDVEYQEDLTEFQVPYTDAQAAIGWTFDYSERSALTTRARASRYEIESGEQRSDAYGLELELGTDTTQTLRTFLRIGAQNTDLTNVVNDDTRTETSWLAGGGLRWVAGLTDLFLDATRTVGPTSSGFIVERDQLRLRLDRAVTPRFSFFTGVRGVRDEAIDENTTFTGRRYATADLGVRWRMQQTLSLLASVDYTWQEFGEGGEDADSSGALLTFVYEPRRRD